MITKEEVFEVGEKVKDICSERTFIITAKIIDKNGIYYDLIYVIDPGHWLNFFHVSHQFIRKVV